jgi:hypothetical protein
MDIKYIKMYLDFESSLLASLEDLYLIWRMSQVVAVTSIPIQLAISPRNIVKLQMLFALKLNVSLLRAITFKR